MFFMGMFLVASCILCFALFYNYGNEAAVSKAELSKRIAEEEQFEELVTEALPTIDTTYSKIAKFNPNVQALFLENDINNSLGAIRSYYNRRPYDDRYKCFIHTSKLLQNLFYDKRELNGNYNDIKSISKLLEDCRLSQRQLQATMGAQK